MSQRLISYLKGVLVNTKETFMLSATGRLKEMEGLRGYAVILVFLTHFFAIYALKFLKLDFDKTRLMDFSDISGKIIFYLGHSSYGVDLFFLLSGFLIYKIIIREGENFRYGAFLKKRFLRIYPAFFISLVIYASFALLFGKDDNFNFIAFLKQLAFLNALGLVENKHVFNYVTWSLFWEAMFYLVFPAMLLLKSFSRKISDIASVWILAVVVFVSICYVRLRYGEQIYIGFMDTRFIMFFIGASFAIMNPQTLRNAAAFLPTWMVIALYASSTFVHVLWPTGGVFFWLYLFTCPMLFVKSCYGAGLLNNLFAGMLPRFFGNISYSFYLVHPMVILVSSVIFEKYLAAPINNRFITFTLLFTSCLGLTVIGASLLFILVERRYFAMKKQVI